MKIKYANILSAAISAAVAVILTLAIFFGVKPLPEAVLEENTDNDGNRVNAVCISDIGDLQVMPYVNYIPDEFVKLGESTYFGKAINLKETKLANRGTLKFLILNIEPFDEQFDEKYEALNDKLQGDNYWHVSLYLPACFSACNVYVRSVLQYRSGEIEGYDFIEFSEYNDITEVHKSATEPNVIDLRFYTERRVMGPGLSRRANIVTVHYEAEDGKFAGFEDMPLIGSGEAIEKVLSRDKTFFAVMALLSAMVAAIFAFTCFLKKSLFALPQVVTSVGIGGFALVNMLMFSSTAIPYALRTLAPICAAVIGLAAVFTTIIAIKTGQTEFFAPPPVTFVFLIVYACVPLQTPQLASPSLWLLTLILGITLFSAFKFFADQEKRNAYLTNNLQAEVAASTKDLKDIIDERDKLLRYVSHDMKKPITGVKRFLEEIKLKETDPENRKALNVVSEKIDGIADSLVQLQKYSKLNFSAEESSVIKAGEVILKVANELKPDCEANGIKLTVLPSRVKVYAKKQTLISVINNLVFNAVEHAECSHIVLSATKARGVCRIAVTDDGKGPENGENIFLPYYSDDVQEGNLGLGLYICRQHIISMSGSLVFTRENGKTVFTVTLPLA